MFKYALAVLAIFFLVLFQVDALSTSLMESALEHLGMMNNSQPTNIFPTAHK